MGSGKGKTRRASARQQTRNTADKNEQLVLYHGTTDARIQSEGLRPGAYLATSKELAWYYAEVSDEVDGLGSPMVFEVHVKRGWLEADKPSLCEPVGYGDRKSVELEEAVATHEGPLDADASLSLVGSAYCSEAILPENIVYIHTEPWMA